jgi:hypothetical protein
MYVRIARFEGGDAASIDKQIGGIRGQMAEGRERMASGDVPGEITEAMGALKRVVIAADREGGRMASLTFAETDEGMRKVDAWLNTMSPDPSGGQRASVEIYEIAIDEETGRP